MKAASKVWGTLMLVASIGSFNPCLAADFADDTGNSVPVFAWTDVMDAAQSTANLEPQLKLRASRRTKSNISTNLPPTATCSVNLSVLNESDYAATNTWQADMVSIVSPSAQTIPVRTVYKRKRVSDGY